MYTNLRIKNEKDEKITNFTDDNLNNSSNKKISKFSHNIQRTRSIQGFNEIAQRNRNKTKQTKGI